MDQCQNSVGSQLSLQVGICCARLDSALMDVEGRSSVVRYTYDLQPAARRIVHKICALSLDILDGGDSIESAKGQGRGQNCAANLDKIVI